MLLAGMGAGVLLAVIALYVPAEGRPYAWIIAGLTFLLCVLRAIMSIASAKRNVPNKPERMSKNQNSPTNIAKFGALTRIRRARFRSGRLNVLRSGWNTRIEELDMEAGRRTADDDTERE
ncbi:hypothetical protein [Spongiactinospora sp. TRM90649]|uniref:hypothetical protein n=1 Tax=Spongiactinospora sp. TRM90649 TaxID=3031114 RepID=UPI0023F663AF|nr:hypothetical protein [Spongiactinospora sp. TRM90649]MDF5752749.1 hypothetical protein [Spongiactinospora sp. TRM90649]